MKTKYAEHAKAYICRREKQEISLAWWRLSSSDPQPQGGQAYYCPGKIGKPAPGTDAVCDNTDERKRWQPADTEIKSKHPQTAKIPNNKRKKERPI